MNSLDSRLSDPRVELVNPASEDDRGRCVVYWMRRAQRALDNPALETAIDIANQRGLPVAVFFCLRPYLPYANLRHFTFMLEGIKDTADRLERRRIGFVMRPCERNRAATEFARFCQEVGAALVVTDRNPLNSNETRLFPADFGLPVVRVDADTVVPISLIGREHYSARTIRPKIQTHLPHFLRPIRAQRAKRSWRVHPALFSLIPSRELSDSLQLDRSVAATRFRGGTTAGLARLRSFIRRRLAGYAANRNQPQLDGTSQLSPYLHFGQLSPLTVALAVLEAGAPEQDVRAFLEELIVRRELAINFTVYNRRWRSVESCEPWALRSLKSHAGDARPYRYSERQLKNAETHDSLWNAAQRQMVESGWMHGYMRMYWAKKILEWSPSADEAYQISAQLNDRFELDGRDSNGYAGVAWAVGGKHDRAWGPERPIYGAVRYMSALRTGRKFDSDAYIRRWLGGSVRTS